MEILNGVRVLDLSRVLAGPYCTGMLADIGADVVKVEGPHGDDARHLGPFRDGESVYFAQLNRGKRSVVLDLKDPDDHRLLLDLAERADVVVENFRPGVAERLGIDHASLSARNERLIYASISGFGQDGPMRGRPAYDLIVQAMSGLMAGTGSEDGPPTRVGESIGDVTAGMFAAWAICAALFERERTRRGRHLDVSMLDGLLAMQVTQMSLLTATGALPGRVGNRHPVSTPFDTYRTSDGMVALAVANETVWSRFTTMLGRPDLPRDSRFATDPDRTRHQAALREVIEEWSSRLTTGEVVELADAAGVPAGPIWELDEALASEQVRGRGLVGSFDHPVLGTTSYLRQPVRFVAPAGGGDGETLTFPPGPNAQPSPTLGADRDEVLRDWRPRAPLGA
jgi:CoA:oxalate CoA-transferase